MSEDFYPFVDSGDPTPDNSHLNGIHEAPAGHTEPREEAAPTYTTRISVYDDLLSTPRVIVIERDDVRTYLEEITNTVYRTMKEQGGNLSLMIIRELVENFIHAHFTEPVISIMDGGDTIRFADQGPGICDKERAFEFGVTSASRNQKRYIRGTGSGLPMVQQYVENAGGAISIEDNLNQGTVVTVSVDPARVAQIRETAGRGAAVRASAATQQSAQPAGEAQRGGAAAPGQAAAPWMGQTAQTPGDPMMQAYPQAMAPGYPLGAAGAPGMAGAPQPAAAYGAPAAAGSPYGYDPTTGQPYQPYGFDPAAQAAAMPYGAPGMGYAPGGYPYPGAPQQSYQQYGHQFSTTPQQTYQPAGFPQQNPWPAQPAPSWQQGPDVGERGVLALRFLSQAEQGGPTDLMHAYGKETGSVPTWSRELDTLTTYGLVRKRGQKFVITEMGQAWLHQHQ